MQHWVCRIGDKTGRFLRIMFGCHARADRSFFFRGRQFPICARCTGELVGMIAGIPIAVVLGVPQFWYVVLLMIPMLLDGFIQLLTSYESRNIRRLWTGILFGIAFIFFLICFHRTCVYIAGEILKLFMDPEKVERAVRAFT